MQMRSSSSDCINRPSNCIKLPASFVFASTILDGLNDEFSSSFTFDESVSSVLRKSSINNCVIIFAAGAMLKGVVSEEF